MGVTSIDYAISRWVKWCQSLDLGIGYASRSVEGRLIDGDVLGIRGSGQYNPPEDAVAELVERAVCSLRRHNNDAADVFVERSVWRTSYRKLAKAKSFSVRKVERLEDEAYGYIAGDINS